MMHLKLIYAHASRIIDFTDLVVKDLWDIGDLLCSEAGYRGRDVGGEDGSHEARPYPQHEFI